jgi:hypothetical protein
MWFAIIGIFVVAGVVVAIGLSADPTDPNPKLQYGLIFGVVAVFVFGLLLIQRRDLQSGAEADARMSVGGGPREVDDPTKLEEGELWAALAVKPIDREALAARNWMWGTSRRSNSLAWAICILIFLTVPSIYLLESFVPLLIGGPLIAALAVFGSIRAIGSGGELDQGYESMDRAMKPLGLGVAERPEVGFETRGPTMPGYSARLRGPLVLGGERQGRGVAGEWGERSGGQRSRAHVRGEGSRRKNSGSEGRTRGGCPGPPGSAELHPVEASQRPRRPERRGDRAEGEPGRLAL